MRRGGAFHSVGHRGRGRLSARQRAVASGLAGKAITQQEGVPFFLRMSATRVILRECGEVLFVGGEPDLRKFWFKWIC